jgi:RNA polymerase sigma-70 factor (ECF subfamily)
MSDVDDHDGDGTDRLDRLAAAAAAGDRAALERLLTEIRPAVLRRCSRILPFSGDAEDACQDALIAVAKGIHGFQGRSRFTTWLYPVVANTAFATYRRLRQRAVESGLEHAPDVVDPARVSVLAGSRLDLVEAFERLRGSQPHLVDAVVLRDLMGLEYAEIADRLEVPLGTVKSRINHGRSALRVLLTAP